MNGTQLARKLKTSTRVVGGLIRSGTIKAERVKRAWEVDADSVKNFCSRNNAAVEKLRKEYISLYWGGVTVPRLQERVKGDFSKRGIIYPADGFAEQTIYKHTIGNQ